MVECTCGKWYPSQQGAEYCAQNRHGKDGTFSQSRRQIKCVETFYYVECEECGAIMNFLLNSTGNDVIISIPPHICEVEAPEINIETDNN